MTTLTQQIADFKTAILQQLPEEVKTVMLADLARLQEEDILTNVPKVGDKITGFSLPNQNGKEVALETLLADGPVVITFYRGGWCPYCNLELRAYQQILGDLKELGARLVAITPEMPDASLSTIEKNELEFEVLSDVDATYAKSLSLVFNLSEKLRAIYKQFGFDVEAHNGAGRFDLPVAGTFVVDTTGTITYAFAEIDYTKRAEPAEIVEHIKTLN